MLLFYKSVDQSVLKEGLTIPVNQMEHFFEGVGFALGHGEEKAIRVNIDGITYDAKVRNIDFKRKDYPTHKDVLQIRYGKNSPLAVKLREMFTYTQEMLQYSEETYGNKKLSWMDEKQKEFIAIYATPIPGVVQFDCILNSEFREEAEALSELGELAAEGVLDVTDEGAGILLRTKIC